MQDFWINYICSHLFIVRVKKATLILIVFTLYGVNHYMFERHLFFNELLSMIGLFVFVRHYVKPGLRLSFPQEAIYRSVLALLALFIVYAVVSLSLKTNWYYYFRNLSIVYTVFTFFIGYHLYPQQFIFFSRARKWLYGFALFSFATATPNLIDRNAYMYWLTLIQKDWRIKGLMILTILSILYILAYTSLTVAVILILVIGVLVIPRYWMFIGLALVGLGVMVFLFSEAAPILKLYRHPGYSLFGNVHFVYAHHPWFQLDHNSSWRMIFWYRTVVELFPQNLAGIGIGTPLLPYLPEVTTTDQVHTDEYMAHVTGTHNTFITVFVRFGILSVLLFAFIYHTVFKEFYQHRTYYTKTRNDLGLFMAFITISIIGLFNLVIETPTLSSVFWVSLGFVSRAIYMRKSQKNPTT
jgi:hypothetical protein